MQKDIVNYIEKINNEFMPMVGGSFCRIDTAEIFTLTEVQKYAQKKMEAYTIENVAKIKLATLDSMGITPDQILIKRNKKEKHKNNKSRYEGGDFNITYRAKIEVITEMKLNVNEKLVYYVLRDFISYPSNCIMINEQIPSFPELEPLVGIKDRTIRKALKSLEEKNLVKLIQSGHKKAIYVNPAYYASGKELNIDVLEMFGLVECDDRKVQSYL